MTERGEEKFSRPLKLVTLFFNGQSVGRREFFGKSKTGASPCVFRPPPFFAPLVCSSPWRAAPAAAEKRGAPPKQPGPPEGIQADRATLSGPGGARAQSLALSLP